MSLVSDSERERAAATLRQQFVHGRLSIEELGDRVELALRARHRRDFRRAFRGLPPLWRDADELRRIARQAQRAGVRLLVAAGWAFFTFILLISFAITLATDGARLGTAIEYAVAWLAATALAWHLRRRA